MAGCRSRVVDDRQEVGQALAGAGAAGDDEALARAGQFHRFDLVLVEVEGLAARCCGKHLPLAACKRTPRSQIVYRGRAGVGGADLEQEVGPQPRFLDERADERIRLPWCPPP